MGDANQLPPTVISRAAGAANLSQSLFERLQRAGGRAHLLAEQFRMHPSISKWPAAYFYGGRLRDAGSLRRGAPFHARACYPPLAFFDCRDGREASGGSNGGGGSLRNAIEASLAAALLSGLHADFGTSVGSCAVITPYRAQLPELRRALRAALPAGVAERIEVATVDGFQGREADVVVFSCVRGAWACLWNSFGGRERAGKGNMTCLCIPAPGSQNPALSPTRAFTHDMLPQRMAARPAPLASCPTCGA